MVVQLLDAELAATEDAAPAGRAALREGAPSSRSGCRARRTPRPPTAQCLELKPTDVAAAHPARGASTPRSSDYAALVEVYRLLAAALEDAAAARALPHRRGPRCSRSASSSREDAAACFREAFALDRTDPLLLAAMKRVAEREGRTDELLAALAAEAELLGAQAAPDLPADRQGVRAAGPQGGRARRAARRAPREPERAAGALRAGRASTRRRAATRSSPTCCSRGWARINDESELVAINLRLAALYEEDLKRDADAIARYQAILARVPGHAAALAGLGKLYYRTQNWEGLVSRLRRGDRRRRGRRAEGRAHVQGGRDARGAAAAGRRTRSPATTSASSCSRATCPRRRRSPASTSARAASPSWSRCTSRICSRPTDRDQLITTLNKMAVDLRGPAQRPRPRHRVHEAHPRSGVGSPAHHPQPGAPLRARRALARADRSTTSRRRRSSATPSRCSRCYHRNAEILEEQLKDRAGRDRRVRARAGALARRTCPRSRRWAGSTRRTAAGRS